MKEHIHIRLDHGLALDFIGKLFSEAVWTDESGALIHHKLYADEAGGHVFVIQKTQEDEVSTSAFRLCLKGDVCLIETGEQTAEMPLPILLAGIKGLYGIGDEHIMRQIEEIVRTAAV